VDVLGPRALNRALLARQFLSERTELGPLAVIEALVGLQAQALAPPYFGLWSRIAGFDRDRLARLLIDRELVRIKLMRGTVHMVGAADALWLRPLVAVAIERGHRGAFGRRMGGADRGALADAVRELLAAGPLTGRELGSELVARGIGDDVEAIASAALTYAALVQLPPRGIWGIGGQARYATLESWTGRRLEPGAPVDGLVLRYLRAFGPASVMDAQNWSGLTRLGASFELLRPRLVTFRDEHGRELFDLPEAPRPDPDAPAPVRFLGEYDNVLLGHADRRRIIPEGFGRETLPGSERRVNQLLVDGMLSGSWSIRRDGPYLSTIVVDPARELSAAERDDVAEEAQRLADFTADEDRCGFEFAS
jgi:hypothetical protein